MRPKVFAPAVIFLTAACYSFGQKVTTVTLQGRVVDDVTSTPIRSAELRFKAPGARILTADIESDSDGKFTAPEMPAGVYDVVASRAGYAPVDFRLGVPVGDVTVRLTRYGAIGGKIVNAAGRPVLARVLAIGGRQAGGAQVVILTKDPDTGGLTTFRQVDMADGTDGRYRAENLPPGDYVVALWYSAIDEGAGMQMYPDNAHPRTFTIQGGEEFDDVDFLVNPDPSSRVSGKVEIPEGAKGQYWISLGLQDRFRIPLITVQAGDDGVFQFDKVPVGRYDVFVAGPAGGGIRTLGMAQPGTRVLFGRAQIQVAGEDVVNLGIPVQPGKTLNVLLHSTVAGDGGCPASLDVAANTTEPWPVVNLQSGATANFQKPVALSNLPPGRLSVFMTASGENCFMIGEEPLVDLSGDNSPQQVAIEVGPGGSVKGMLSPAVSGTLVALKSLNRGGFYAGRVYTGENGQFEFQKLAPGGYRIEATGYRGQEVEVKSGSTSELSLTANAKGLAQ